MHPLKCVLVKPPFALPINKAYDVAGLGLNAVDHLCVVPHFPRFDSKLRILDFSRQGGGQAATAMVTCQRLVLRPVTWERLEMMRLETTHGTPWRRRG